MLRPAQLIRLGRIIEHRHRAIRPGQPPLRPLVFRPEIGRMHRESPTDLPPSRRAHPPPSPPPAPRGCIGPGPAEWVRKRIRAPTPHRTSFCQHPGPPKLSRHASRLLARAVRALPRTANHGPKLSTARGVRLARNFFRRASVSDARKLALDFFPDAFGIDAVLPLSGGPPG